MSGLISLTYRSHAEVQEFSVHSLDILREALARNARDGLTGFLHRDGPWFFQTLEGEPDKVHRLVDGLKRDWRHSWLKVLVTTELEQRRFDDWAMAYSTTADVSMMGYFGVSEHIALSLLTDDQARDFLEFAGRMKAAALGGAA
ncbi:BLUF domain-containing protein [Mesobaculum littorinae]|uniref:BLUF domain-containing protein n=1 Tax=Mesobaculum littorinae TaxID=2486419 RepID=A0A438AGI0_9RHOB|nr:BLUF domain-containing protein [Mesobaculum littorinae]RVV97820.1 BLUF domain-containing protein [Mesobaculum littorinae]